MANIPETPDWSESVPQIAITDKVLGGEDGAVNKQAEHVVNRTAYLKQQVEAAGELAAQADGKADDALAQIASIETAAGSAAGSAATALQSKQAAEASAALAAASQAASAADAAQASTNANYAAQYAATAQQASAQASADATAATSAASSAVATAGSFASTADAKTDEFVVLAETATAAVTVARNAAEQAAANAQDQASAAAADAYIATISQNAAMGSANAAEAAKAEAEAARDAAQLSAGIYATTAAGLAATINGQYFSVPSAESTEYLVLYKNNAGTAQDVKSYPSTAEVARIGQAFVEVDPKTDQIADVELVFRDSEGRAALYIDSDGLTHFKNPGVDQAISDIADLQPRMSAVEVSSSVIEPGATQFERQLVWGVKDRYDKVGLALDGSAVLHSVGNGDFSDVTVIDGMVYVAGASLGNDFYALRARRDGNLVRIWSSDQEYVTIPGRTIIAVPEDGKLQLLLSSGQSLSVGYGTFGVVGSPSVNPWPHNILMVNGAVSTGPSASQLPGESITDIVPMVNGPDYDSYGLAAMVQATRLLKSCGGGLPKTWVFGSHGRGGATIAELMDQTTHWMFRNGITQMKRAKELANEYGLELSDHVILMFVQGESDNTNNNYQANLVSLYSQYLAAVKAELGANARLSLIVDQLALNIADKVMRAQYGAAYENRDIYLAMHKTVCNWKHSGQLEAGNGDYTHLTKAGYWLQGCYFGRAIYSLITAGDWEPIVPREVTVEANKIIVRFKTVYGKLVNDTSLWSVNNMGFIYSDAQGATIVSVSVHGDTATIMMSGSISSNTSRKLSLGFGVESTGHYQGSTIRDEAAIYIPETNEYLYNFACAWEATI